MQNSDVEEGGNRELGDRRNRSRKWFPLGDAWTKPTKGFDTFHAAAMSRDGECVAASWEEHVEIRKVMPDGKMVKHGEICQKANKEMIAARDKQISISGNCDYVAVSIIGNLYSSTEYRLIRVYKYSSARNKYDQLGNDIRLGFIDQGPYHTVSISDDGQRVASCGSQDNTVVDSRGNYIEKQYLQMRCQVFEWKETEWKPLGQILDLADHPRGNSLTVVALSPDGGVIAASAPYFDSIRKNGRNRHGRVHVYELDDNGATLSWKPRAEFTGEENSLTGRSLSLNGEILAIGSPGWENRGRVQVYKWDIKSSSYEIVGDPIDGPGNKQSCGTSVSLSSDGNRIAIGCDQRRNIVSTGKTKGFVLVQEYNDSQGKWIQMRSRKKLSGAERGVHLGWDVNLSGDGRRLMATTEPRQDDSYLQIFQNFKA